MGHAALAAVAFSLPSSRKKEGKVQELQKERVLLGMSFWFWISMLMEMEIVTMATGFCSD
jgi:hypothetical protein